VTSASETAQCTTFTSRLSSKLKHRQKPHQRHHIQASSCFSFKFHSIYVLEHYVTSTLNYWPLNGLHLYWGTFLLTVGIRSLHFHVNGRKQIGKSQRQQTLQNVNGPSLEGLLTTDFKASQTTHRSLPLPKFPNKPKFPDVSKEIFAAEIQETNETSQELRKLYSHLNT